MARETIKVTRVSKDPFETSIHDAGSYVTTFNSFAFHYGQEQVNGRDLMWADSKSNEMAFFVRNEDGYIVVEDGKPLVEVKSDRDITFTGPMPECSGCDYNTQTERQNQKWWNL